MGRTLGVSSILAKDFKNFPDLDAKWKAAIGDIGKPFTWLIYGHPKNGKTSFVLQFCLEMTRHCKVYYNSVEQGLSKTFQEAVIYTGLTEARQGRFMLGDMDSYKEMLEKIKSIKPGLIVIDSRDYMNLTIDQWKRLTRMYPNKCFVVICWEQSGKPAGKYAKDIEYMVDMVTHVKDFMAYTRGRYGMGQFDVYPGRKKQQKTLF